MSNVLITGDLTIQGTSNIPNILKIAVISDEKSSGTSGGNCTGGATADRTLNTLVDPHSLITMVAGNVKFKFDETGTYIINGKVPAYKCNRHKAYLCTGTNTVLRIGSSQYLWSGREYTSYSKIFGHLVVTSTSQEYKLRQYTQTTRTQGRGVPVGSGAGESYSKLTIIKISD